MTTGRCRLDSTFFNLHSTLCIRLNGALTWICTTNLRLRRAACTSTYTLRAKLASVAGLAPARPGLKDRLLELLCIHGRFIRMDNQEWQKSTGTVPGYVCILHSGFENGPQGWYRANVSSSSGRR